METWLIVAILYFVLGSLVVLGSSFVEWDNYRRNHGYLTPRAILAGVFNFPHFFLLTLWPIIVLCVLLDRLMDKFIDASIWDRKMFVKKDH